jgi:hypothetical protein
MRIEIHRKYLCCVLTLLVSCGKNNREPSNSDASDSNVDSVVLERSSKARKSGVSSDLNTVINKRQKPTSITSETLSSRRLVIFKEMESAAGGKLNDLSEDELQASIRHYWIPSLNQVINPKRMGDPEMAISAMFKSESEKETLIGQLLTGKFTSISDPAEQEFLVAAHILSLVVAAEGGGSLPEVISDRSNDAKITRGDIFLFEVLRDAFVDLPTRKPLSQSSKEKWQQLTTAPNRIYRLLALETFSSVQPGPKEWLDFYRNYLNETDPEIFREATLRVSQTSVSEASAVLLEFKNKCDQSVESTFISDLDLSIEWLKQQPSLNTLTK